MIKIDKFNLNITEELKNTLRQNPPVFVKKAVFEKVKDDKGDLIQKKDDNNRPVFVEGVEDSHSHVYFDSNGRYYFYAFRSMKVDVNGDVVEILITNPKIKTEKDCTLYAKGIPSHRQIIPGSELWDNGSDSSMPHTELISKGDPNSKIVKVMTREEVLNVDLTGTGDSIADLFAKASPAEKAILAQKIKEEMNEL